MWKQWQILFSQVLKSLWTVTVAIKLKDTCSLEGKLCKPRRCTVKKQRHHFTDRDPYNQSHGFTSSHIHMWERDHKEGWAPKNWCFWIVVPEKTLESPLEPVHPKGNQSWIFIGKTNTETEVAILWPPKMGRTDSLEKTLILGKIEGRRRGGQEEMVGWHHWL